MTSTASKKIAYQGEPGAFSHQACKRWFPDNVPTPFPTFEAAFAAVNAGECELGMIPAENALAGRVADVHQLLPHSGLKIVGERFLPIEMMLMGVPETELANITVAFSHTMALLQCRNSLLALNIKPEMFHDTAGSARALSETRELNRAAIAPEIAAELYGLKILQRNLEDAHNNTTRFLVLTAQDQVVEPSAEKILTSFVFGVRNIPAALYKALGGFATNGINMIRLESYIRDGIFASTFFYAEVEGRPSDHLLKLAFEELAFFAEEVEILGVYPMDPFRATQSS
ncbi:prephenate dehydratase [Asticcacaulis sp. YBE204]|uniref:prephenate dehydratase n=1 Tax=Asticcacaulis sp. YBE204 TaxID=1282363 RepID=UPI0003C3F537|nr:prephenate dehydratase [Asticcacaulis sp. YBE204]ESQ78552.1 prephenate dehydratase [Asticcacaulis sp. YBE204]